MNEYLEGLIFQAYGKAQKLLEQCSPNNIDDRFQRLVITAHNELESLCNEILSFISDPIYQHDQEKRLLEYRRINKELEGFENIVLAVLSRHRQEDADMSLMSDEICREINYPLPKPIISCLSQDYYCIYQHVNLICVPLLESYYLLHLPDLFHELGHPLLSSIHNPSAKRVLKKWAVLNNEVRIHFSNARKQRISGGRKEMIPYLEIWRKSWLDSKLEGSWSTEFFCDLFATYTCGPAFAWSHLYLSTKKDRTPNRLSLFTIDSHPNSEARMQVILAGLEILGFNQDAANIRKKWNEYVILCNIKKTGYQDFAYPPHILDRCAEVAFEAVKESNCIIYTEDFTASIVNDLNEAWNEFWKSPSQYPEWEENKIREMRKRLSSGIKA